MKEYELGVCYRVINDQLNKKYKTKMQFVLQKNS